MRIVSLLPSATDIVCALGLEGELVGRTHECDWPPGIERVPAMTRDVLPAGEMSSREIDAAVGASAHSGSSIYALDHEALAAAKPDLILTQELCDVCAVSYREVARAARVMEPGPTVLSLEPSGIDDILEHVLLVGRVCGAEDRAREVVAGARARLDVVRAARAGREPVPTVCIEWLEPLYAAGHWVPEQVSAAGGRELLGRLGAPSHRIAWEEVVAARPEALFVMPCGLGISRTLAEIDALRALPGWDEVPAVRAGHAWVVDGPAYFNRPGPRVVRGAEVLAALLWGTAAVTEEEARAIA